MKTFVATIGRLCLNFIFFFMKLQRVRTKVVFLSRQSNVEPDDFVKIRQKMEQVYPSITCTVLAKSIKPGILGAIAYSFHILRQMHHIASSSVAILDTYCIPISLLKQRDSLTVIQIWHDIGVLKKAGYAAMGKEGGRSEHTAKLMRMHANYDIILCSGEACREGIGEMFNYPIFKVQVFPLPRVDMLRDVQLINSTCENILADYPVMKNKKNVVFAPTFRNSEILLQEKWEELVDNFDFSAYNLVFKPHPLSELTVSDGRVITDDKYSSIEMIMASDIVIADYSSIIYEAAILNKQQYFYAFDYEEYIEERGFFIDYPSEIPGKLHKSAAALCDDIAQNNYDFEKAKSLLDKYVDLSKPDCALEIVKLIAKQIMI